MNLEVTILIHLKELYFDEFETLLAGYFKNVCLLGQRVYTGSNIWNISAQEQSSYSEFVVENSGREFYFAESAPLFHSPGFGC